MTIFVKLRHTYQTYLLIKAYIDMSHDSLKETYVLSMESMFAILIYLQAMVNSKGRRKLNLNPSLVLREFFNSIMYC